MFTSCTHELPCSASCTVLFFLLLAEKMAGAMSFADAPSSHAECQKRALAPSPSVIFVAALKSCRLVSS
jgi:hypothetical protein